MTQAQTDAAITKVGYAPGTYWMGLRQHCAACEFEWSDLSPVTVQQYFKVFIAKFLKIKSSELLMKVDYTAWFDSEPNNSGDGEGNSKIIELPFQLLFCSLMSF